MPGVGDDAWKAADGDEFAAAMPNRRPRGCVNAVRGSSNFSGVLRRQVRVRPTAGLIAQAPAPVPPNNFAAAVSYLVAARDFLPQLRRDL